MSDGPYNDRVCPKCGGTGRNNIGSTSECECYYCMGTGHISTKMDMFQGCTHHIPINGYPRSIVQPQKTWLDECAMMAMQGMLCNSKTNDGHLSRISQVAYQLAEAMLAEKMKREAQS